VVLSSGCAAEPAPKPPEGQLLAAYQGELTPQPLTQGAPVDPPPAVLVALPPPPPPPPAPAPVVVAAPVDPAVDAAAAAKFARLDAEIHKGFKVEAQHRRYTGTPDDIFGKRDDLASGLYRKDAAEAVAHDQALAIFLETCRSPRWTAVAFARRGMVFDELWTALDDTAPPQLSFFTPTQDALLKRLTASGVPNLMEQANDLRKAVMDGWQMRKDRELLGAGEIVVRHYAVAVAIARANGVSHPRVTRANERLATLTDVFGEPKMREWVTRTHDPEAPSGLAFLAYTDGMYRAAASQPGRNAAR